eukprot:6158588-Pleurochrysis_carterae.AAC.2
MYDLIRKAFELLVIAVICIASPVRPVSQNVFVLSIGNLLFLLKVPNCISYFGAVLVSFPARCLSACLPFVLHFSNAISTSVQCMGFASDLCSYSFPCTPSDAPPSSDARIGGFATLYRRFRYLISE